jgi:hypothetical protein
LKTTKLGAIHRHKDRLSKKMLKASQLKFYSNIETDGQADSNVK